MKRHVTETTRIRLPSLPLT